MSNNNTFGAGVLWSYLQSWMARGITAMSFLIVGLYLGPEEFGLFSVVAAILMFAELMCEQTLSQTAVQLKILDSAALTSIFFLALLAGLAFAVSIGFGAEHLAAAFGAPSLAALLHVAAFCPILIGLTAVPMGLLRKGLAFKVLARRTVIGSGVSSAVGIGLVIAGYGAWGLVIQAILYYAIGLLVLWMNCEWRPNLAVKWDGIKAIAKLATWNGINKLADFVETRGVELIIGAFGGIQALGVFAFANKLAQTAFLTISSPALEVVFAEVARQRKKTKIKDAIRNGQLIIGTLPTGLLFGLACIATPLLSLLYGDRWMAAAVPLSVLTVAYLVRGLLYVFGSALLALGESRTATVFTVLRAGLTLLFCYLAFRGPDQIQNSALGFLASALLVAPISSLVLSKKIGISVKALVAVPLKVSIALFLGTVVVSVGRLVNAGEIATIANAVFAGFIFLLAVVALNAGLIAHSLRARSKTGGTTVVLQWIYALAVHLVRLRGKIQLLWFELSLRFSSWSHSHSPIDKRHVLVIPADTSELDGSLGDQALLLGLQALIEPADVCLIVSETYNASKVFEGTDFIRAWSGLLAGWKLGKEIAATRAIYVIGADVMDGYYSEAVSCQRLIALRVFNNYNVPASVLSFSFNPSPNEQVVKAFKRLPKDVRICLRDAVSLERFERIVGRPANLVSDLAFLVHSKSGSTVETLVKPWAALQRNKERKVLGININPQVVAHLTADTETAIALSVAKACEQLIVDGTSIVLIPHDFRPGCADLRVMGLVWSNISAQAQNHSLLLEKAFTAQEIKAVCTEFDLVFSARMHLAIGALSVGTPVCGMQYQGKFAGLFQHFAFGEGIFVSPEDALDAMRLAEFLQGHLSQSKQLQSQVLRRLPAVRDLARQNVPATQT